MVSVSHDLPVYGSAGEPQPDLAQEAVASIITREESHHRITLRNPQPNGKIRHTLYEMWPARVLHSHLFLSWVQHAGMPVSIMIWHAGIALCFHWHDHDMRMAVVLSPYQ